VLLGTYKYNLDSKNRLNVPKKFIAELSENMVISKGFDGCLELRSATNFQNHVNQLLQLQSTKLNDRKIQRQLLANANEVQFDKVHRILLPQNLILEANLTKAIIIIGIGNKLEIWDEEKYLALKTVTDKELEKLAEKVIYV